MDATRLEVFAALLQPGGANRITLGLQLGGDGFLDTRQFRRFFGREIGQRPCVQQIARRGSRFPRISDMLQSSVGEDGVGLVEKARRVAGGGVDQSPVKDSA